MLLKSKSKFTHNVAVHTELEYTKKCDSHNFEYLVQLFCNEI